MIRARRKGVQVMKKAQVTCASYDLVREGVMKSGSTDGVEHEISPGLFLHNRAQLLGIYWKERPVR